MKITIYALHLGVGGVEKYVATLANMLANIGNVSIVVTYKLANEPAFYIDPRVKIEYLISDKTPNKDKIKEAIVNKSAISLIREVLIAVKLLYRKRHLNIKSIEKCDSDVIISTRIFHNKIISKYAAKNIIKITGEHNYHNDDEKYISKVINSCKNFDYFIPISKYLKDFYEPYMTARGVKAKYIRFCVDDFANNQRAALEGDNLISVGRLSKEKGYSDLISVFEIIHRKNRKAVLNIIGDGDERESLENLAKEKKLTDNVVFHGFRNKEYVYSELNKSSVFLMTSYTESFGLVLLEAMNSGVPCVAFSSANGAKEIISDQENGILIDQRDIGMMADTVCELLEDRERLKQLSEGAIKTAELYSYEETEKEWQKFIMSLKERDKEL